MVQTLSEIRQLLTSIGRRPGRGRGQHFLIDANLMHKLLELAEPPWELLALEVKEALQALGEITGDEVGEAVLDQIFSQFCIGK